MARSTAPPSSSRGAELGDERTEAIEYAVRNPVPSAEGVPLDGEAAARQEIAQVLAAGEGQHGVHAPVTLQHARSCAFFRERAPFRLRHRRSAQDDQARGRALGAQHDIAGEHRTLGETTEHDALTAHLALELGIDRDQLANPWLAAISSAIAFTVGALLPVVAIVVPPQSARIPVAFVAVLLALALTGAVSAHLGGSPKPTAMLRLVVGGAVAMIVTYGIGELLGTAVT